MADLDYPLREICEAWRQVVRIGREQRDEQFGQFANELRKFFNSDHQFMWEETYARGKSGYLKRDGQIRMPEFKISINKIADAVDLYGPALMHRYPTVAVTPVVQPMVSPVSLMIDEQDEQQMMEYQQILLDRELTAEHRETVADIAASYLNWLQIEQKKKPTARLTITDAIVTGLGLVYHELYWPRAGQSKYPRSRFIKWEQYIKDPDAETNEDVQWIAVEWTAPVNLVERKFNLPPGTLKGHKQSLTSQTNVRSQRDAKSHKRGGKSWDLITYTEIFSKNGFGARLKVSDKLDDEVRELVEQWGDFCYIVITDDCDFPLNMPTEALQATTDENGQPLSEEDYMAGLFERAHWPIPFYTDSGGGEDWPVSELKFKVDGTSKWPIGIFKPLIGEIMFVNWAMSFLADRVALHSTDYIGIVKAAVEGVKEQLANQSGPFQFIEIEQAWGQRIDQVLSILPKPDFTGEMWKMIAEVMEIIEKGSGVTELLYGSTSRQMRSSAEAQLLGGNASIRPDDMAEKTDDWYSLCAMKEWQAAVWLLDGQDVIGPLGPAGAWVFENRIVTEEFMAVAADYNYRLVAGSGRKPNKANRVNALVQLGQVATPYWTQLLQMGIVGPYNQWVVESAKALEIDDYEKFTVPTEQLQAMIQQMQQQQQEQESAVDQQQAAERQQEFEREQERKDAANVADLYWKGQSQAMDLQSDSAKVQLKALQELLSAIGGQAA